MKFTMQKHNADTALLSWDDPRRVVPYAVCLPIDAVQRILDLQEAADVLVEQLEVRDRTDAAFARARPLPPDPKTMNSIEADIFASMDRRARVVEKLKNPTREVPS